MKICILSATNLRHMSLVSIYTSRLKDAGVEYDLLYMDKYGEEEKNEAEKSYRFVNVIDPNWSRLKKKLCYMRFRPYAIRTMEINKYDFIIVWNDLAIFMFADYLARKWKGKYCLNIRDNNRYQSPIRKIWYEPVFRNAAFRTISSDAFRTFLPPYEYIQVHSLNETVLKSLQPRTSLREPGKPIRIGFVGYIRYYEINQKLLNVFKNDPRFELHYYGTHAEALQGYADNNGIHNTVFHGTFPVEETARFIGNIDIMNNLYGNDTLNLRTALSIKLYHSIYARIPILVSPGTYMEKITREIDIGFSVDSIDTSMKERLYQWYRRLQFDQFTSNCSAFLSKVLESRDLFDQTFDRYILHKVV